MAERFAAVRQFAGRAWRRLRGDPDGAARLVRTMREFDELHDALVSGRLVPTPEQARRALEIINGARRPTTQE
jgi:hypothetical protein